MAFFGYSQPSLLVYLCAALPLAKRLRTRDFKSLPEIVERSYGPGARVFAEIRRFASCEECGAAEFSGSVGRVRQPIGRSREFQW